MSLKRRVKRLERSTPPPPEPSEADLKFANFLQNNPWAKAKAERLERRIAALAPARTTTMREVFDDPECWDLLRKLRRRFEEENSEEIKGIRAGLPPELSSAANVRCALEKDDSLLPDYLWRLSTWATVRGFSTDTPEQCIRVLEVLRQERPDQLQFGPESGWSADGLSWLAEKFCAFVQTEKSESQIPTDTTNEPSCR